MESRTMKLPVELKTGQGSAEYKIQVPNFWESGIDLRAQICHDEFDSVYYNQGEDIEGHLLFQEYWIGDDKFYFDMNEDGELIAVCPDGWDLILSPDGELIIYPEGTEFEGIGFWIIEENFVVQ